MRREERWASARSCRAILARISSLDYILDSAS